MCEVKTHFISASMASGGCELESSWYLAAQLLTERHPCDATIASQIWGNHLACPFETLRVRVMAPTEKRSFGEVAGEAVLRLWSFHTKNFDTKNVYDWNCVCHSFLRGLDTLTLWPAYPGHCNIVKTMIKRLNALYDSQPLGHAYGTAEVSAFAGLWAGLVPFWAREIPFSACNLAETL